MNRSTLLSSIRATVRVIPGVVQYLSPFARRAIAEPAAYKTYEFFLSAVEGLVNGVYIGLVDSDFVYAMDNLITGQLRDAYTRAWVDDGNFVELPDYLQESLDAMVEDQQSYVVDFFRAIVDARVDKTPIAPLISRAGLWANQWHSAYNKAVRLINVENGGKLKWVEGDTIQKCETCVALDGIVLYAREWEELGVHPQGFPNDKLKCKGGHCDCRLEPTEQRRSPKGFNTVMNIVSLSAEKHYGPGPHPGTGTDQDVHGDGGGGENLFIEYEDAREMSALGSRVSENVDYSEVETNAILEYKGEGYLAINDALRNGNMSDEIQTQIDAIDSAMKRGAAPENFVAYRGISPYEAENLEVGDSFSDNAFVSTSLNYSTAMDFAEKYSQEVFSKDVYYVKINVPKGAHGIYTESVAVEAREEYEFLLPRGSEFEVVEINNYDGYKEIVVKLK